MVEFMRTTAKIVFEARDGHFLEAVVVLDERSGNAPIRLGYPRHIGVAARVGKEIARNMAADGAYDNALYRAARGVVLVEHVPPIAQRVDVAPDSVYGDEALRDCSEVLPRMTLRMDAPQV